ncbi:MAG: TetR/AcrR family transcriptional regulator [Bacteroidetes bacterium]|nr:MAG: TetR/AcrR family transcriptional regulator [Bacteroidota bacterium]
MDKQAHYAKESLKLFLKFGIRSVTIGQITSQLNVSSKTLYQLFGDKPGLVRACFALYSRNSHEDFQRHEAEATNVADLLIRFYQQMVQSLSHISPAFFEDLAGFFPEIYDQEEAYGIHHARGILERGVTEGIFVPGIDTDLCAETLTLLLRAMFEKEAYLHQPSARLLANVLWPYVRGLCTPQGLAEFRRFRRRALSVDIDQG